MIVERDENLVALRFDDGEDLMPRLLETLGDTTSAVIISAVGMLRDFEIGWLGPRATRRNDSMALRDPLPFGDGEPPAGQKALYHAHASLAGGIVPSSGHLFSATVNFTAMVFWCPRLAFERKVIVEGEPMRFFPGKK